MKWKELTTLQKIATITGISSAFLGFVICILDLTGTFSYNDTINAVLLFIFLSMQGIVYWKTHRNLARLYFIMAGLELLLFVIKLII